MRDVPVYVLLLLAATLAVAGDTPGAGQAGNPLPNPGFESGAQHWIISDETSKTIPEAAHEGTAGLRIGSLDYMAGGASVSSARFPVVPGQEISIRFQARTQTSSSGAYIWFSGADGKMLKPEGAKNIAGAMVNQTDNQWHEYSTSSKAPAGAAAVKIWIHSFAGAKGLSDYDDFVITGLAPGVVALPPEPPKAAKARPVAPDPKDLPPRKSPPVIILKFDDVKQVNGHVPACWKHLAEFLETRHIKGSFGVICQTLQEATPETIQWFKDRRQAGQIEFWFHGWDHAVHAEGDKTFNEFKARSYDEQKKRFDDSQKLAHEKLGFNFLTYGPPGGVYSGSFDDNTIRVMQDDPHMKVWLYPQPLDAAGKKLEEAGKVTILDRVWEVNLEGSVGVPDSVKFISGYARHPDREYFVLQGHPAAWGAGGRFDEFVKIIDYLVAEKAVFMTPGEYVASRKK